MYVEGAHEGDIGVLDTPVMKLIGELYVRGGGILRYALLCG